MAASVLAEAASTCDEWSLLASSHAGPADWTSSTQLFVSRVLATRASMQGALSYIDLKSAISHESEMLAAAAVDPVSLYLFHTGNGSSSVLGPALELSSRVSGSARGSAMTALSLATQRPGRIRAAALAAVGAGLLAELRLVVTDGFVQTPHSDNKLHTSGSSYAVKSGLEAMERVLWASPRILPKSTTPVMAVVVPPEEVGVKGRGGRGSAAPSRIASASTGAVAGRTGAKKAGDVPQITPVAAVISPTVAAGASGATTTPGTSVPPMLKPAGAAMFTHFAAAVGPPLLPPDIMPLPADDVKVGSEAYVASEPWLQSLVSETVEEDVVGALPPIPGLSQSSLLCAAALRARAQAVFVRAITEGVKQHDWDAATVAAAGLVECLGSSAVSGTPAQAAAAVVILQSVVAAAELSNLLTASLHPSSRQRLHMRQMEALDARFVCASDTPAGIASARYLASRSLAARMLECSKPIEPILKSLPPGTRVLILQVGFLILLHSGIIT